MIRATSFFFIPTILVKNLLTPKNSEACFFMWNISKLPQTSAISTEHRVSLLFYAKEEMYLF
jgi:hypothetical protein